MLDFLHIRIREARQKTGLSQKAMADQLGVGHNTYAYFERGKTRLFSRNLYRMAEYLNTSPEEILFGERPDEDLLRDKLALDNWKKQIIDSYETRLGELRRELEQARADLVEKGKTLDSLRSTNNYLLDELGKRR